MSYRPCLIAAVDLNDKAAGVVSRASKLAALCQADLVVAHVVDYRGVFESDHIPTHTPAQLQASLVRQARAWVLGLLHHLDSALENIEIWVEAGQPLDEIAKLAAARGARFIVTGQPAWGYLSPLAGLAQDPRMLALSCDVISVEDSAATRPGSGVGGMLRRRLGSRLSGLASGLDGSELPAEDKP